LVIYIINLKNNKPSRVEFGTSGSW